MIQQPLADAARMFIEKYKFHDDRSKPYHWDFDELEFRNSNLLVGKTGAGKTRLLNTIFNVGTNICQKGRLASGDWQMTFAHDGKRYEYSLGVAEQKVTRERLCLLGKKNDAVLLEREGDRLEFDGQAVPALARDRTLVATLQENDSIAPVFRAFGLIVRRSFDQDALSQARGFGNVPKQIEDKFAESGFDAAQVCDLPLANRLYLLERFDKPTYKRITDVFSGVFPDIHTYQIRKLRKNEVPVEVDGIVPMLFLNEKNVARPFPLVEVSSGMAKVLMIITDVLSAPEGSIYLIDEYENSLGVNAIGFLPDLLVERASAVQAIITTHHPFLINVMPIEDWHILHRSGSKVSVTKGADRKSTYDASTQEAFIQLLNDPAYAEDP